MWIIGLKVKGLVIMGIIGLLGIIRRRDKVSGIWGV